MKEYLLFGFGLTLLVLAALFAFIEKVQGASLFIIIGMFTILMSKFDSIKRFKMPSFEAGMWENKKNEADKLIEQMRNIVEIYSNQILIQKVRAGRIHDVENWEDMWKLYNIINDNSKILIQQIDLTEAKSVLENYFQLDMMRPYRSAVRSAISKAKGTARAHIRNAYSENESLTQAWMAFIDKIKEDPKKELLQVKYGGNFARECLNTFKDAQIELKRNFDIDLQVYEHNLQILEAISVLFDRRPVEIAPEHIKWAGLARTPKNSQQ